MRVNIFKIFLILTVGTLMSACFAQIDTARNLPRVSGDFKSELSERYRELAIYEADEMYDWPDADKFAGKALDASSGRVPLAENPKNWVLPKKDLVELQAAFNRLNTALSEGFVDYSHVKAAKAQAAFDCWIEQTEEGWQLDHIAICRQKFLSTMKEFDKYKMSNIKDDDLNSNNLEMGIDRDIVVMKNEGDKCLNENRKNNLLRQLKIHFAHGDAKLYQRDLKLIQDLLPEVTAGYITDIRILGHADKSGSNRFNLKLSFQRAAVIWRSLIESGISPKVMTLAAYGELNATHGSLGDGRDPRDRMAVLELVYRPDYISRNSLACG